MLERALQFQLKSVFSHLCQGIKHVNEAVVDLTDQDTCHLYHCYVEKNHLAEPCPNADPQISE